MGSCDLYTTKAAGGDKKLYKSIENSLESQHESLVRLSASLSPPQLPQDSRSRKHAPALMPEIDLSRDSPFGPLSQIGARRTFAYLIATLNAAHPDYDFSNILRPSDFRKTTGTVIRRLVDSTLLNMRPQRISSLLAPPSRAPLTSSAGSISPSPDVTWGERMWKMIDQEMDLRHCEKYTWDPEDDPFEEESALWTQHYFFFNKDKKRVCYLHFRAFSVISHSPVHTALPFRSPSMTRSRSNDVGLGAEKRAQYWLGHGVPAEDVESWAEDDDTGDNDMLVDHERYDEEYTQDLDDVRDHLGDGYFSYDEDVDDDETAGWGARGKGMPLEHSESLFDDAMEI